MVKEEECFIPTKENTITFPQTVRAKMAKVLTAAKKKVMDILKNKAVEGAYKMICQEQMLNFMDQEEQDVTWKACIYRVT